MRTLSLNLYGHFIQIEYIFSNRIFKNKQSPERSLILIVCACPARPNLPSSLRESWYCKLNTRYDDNTFEVPVREKPVNDKNNKTLFLVNSNIGLSRYKKNIYSLTCKYSTGDSSKDN